MHVAVRTTRHARKCTPVAAGAPVTVARHDPMTAAAAAADIGAADAMAVVLAAGVREAVGQVAAAAVALNRPLGRCGWPALLLPISWTAMAVAGRDRSRTSSGHRAA